jgi:hypothetical protein
MSTSTIKLLQAAAEIAGGENALAARLRIGENLLTAYLSGTHPLPDLLLLRAVDIILERRPMRPRQDFPDTYQDAAE